MIAHRLLSAVFGQPEEINGHGRCPTYMYRWTLGHIGPVKFYVHRFVGDDWSRDLHDHPKRFISIGLWGSYWEQVPATEPDLKRWLHYVAPWFRTFKPVHQHRIECYQGCWTLVIVGPTKREWGFWPEGRFVHWREFVTGPLGDRAKVCS